VCKQVKKKRRGKVAIEFDAHKSLNSTINIRSRGGCGKNDLTAKGAEMARSAQSELCLSVIVLTTIRVKLCAPFVVKKSCNRYGVLTMQPIIPET